MEGYALNQQLTNAWSFNKDDKDTRDYLGEETVNLANKLTAKNYKPAGGAPGGSAGPVKPPRPMKRACP
eukprot:6300782-Pyramimonas_sp.AAC.1